MKYKIFLFTVLLSTQSLIYSYIVDGGRTEVGYMKTELALSFWNANAVDSSLDGYLVGTGMFNSLGDEIIFFGLDFIILHKLGNSAKNNPQGVNIGFELGAFIPINKTGSILLAGGYNYFYLTNTTFTVDTPSFRLGYKYNNIIFSAGYNFTFGMFTTIGFEHPF